MERPASWRVAWITGASSGIGLELARQLAAMGVFVAATGRSVEKLEALAGAHPNVTPFPADVTDSGAMMECARAVEEKLGPIDLAIFSAGIYHAGPAETTPPATYFKSFEINVGGVLNAWLAVRDHMLSRKAGQVAFISSVAGYRGLPRQSAYAPTKAALISLAETLRAELEPEGVLVSVVNPGFVETPMTAGNPRPMPYIVKADDAAARILRGLAKKKFEIVFPFRMALYMKLLRRAPYLLFFPIARMIDARQAAGAADPKATLGDRSGG